MHNRTFVTEQKDAINGKQSGIKELNIGASYLLHLTSQISKKLFRTGRTGTSFLKYLAQNRENKYIKSTDKTMTCFQPVSVQQAGHSTYPFLCPSFPSFFSIKIRTLLLFINKQRLIHLFKCSMVIKSENHHN